jgi:hypothetical protein
MSAHGLTESARMCNFPFKLGQVFIHGAGIAPTHGGFLMCGMDNNPNSIRLGVFSVSLNIFNVTVLLLFENNAIRGMVFYSLQHFSAVTGPISDMLL